MRSRTAMGMILSACALLALAGCYYYVPKAIYEEKFQKSLSGIRAVSAGSTRENVEAHLGRPVKSARLADGRRLDTYEVIGTPAEGGRWDQQRIQITYNAWDRVDKTQLAPPTHP